MSVTSSTHFTFFSLAAPLTMKVFDIRNAHPLSKVMFCRRVFGKRKGKGVNFLCLKRLSQLLGGAETRI